MFWNRKPQPESLNICIVSRKFSMQARAAEHGFLWPIARGMAQKGHNVTVLSWKHPQNKYEIQKEGVQAFFLNSSPQKSSSFEKAVLKKVKELHKKEPFHIIHSIDSCGLSLGKLKKSLGFALSLDADATQMSQLFAIMGMAQESLGGLIRTGVAILYKFITTYYSRDRKLLKSADGVFVTSPQQRILLERYYLYPELKTYIIPYGIELGDFSQRKGSHELQEHLKIPINAHVAVIFSDMTELEEIKNVLGAFTKVAIKKPNSRLIIVGNGPLKKQIEFEMLSLALGSKVIFTGAIKNIEIPEYVSLADIFINLSSRTTGFESNMLEAMAQKKVVIGSEVSPIANIIEDSKDGFLIRPADQNTLAYLMIKIFSGQIQASDIGEQAQTKVTNLFDLQNMVTQTIDACRKVLVSTGKYKASRT